jgi:predicted protein tyrosine phosphatase
MIIVCPLSKVQLLVDNHGVGHVVSLLGPETPHRPFDGIAGDRHLRLTCHDIIEEAEGYTAPCFGDAERLVGFVGNWDARRPLLIHCWAGISRSTAAAFTAMCLLKPDDDEERLAWTLREASPSATPNRLLVSHADRLLGRRGRMVRAIDQIGRGDFADEGVPFFLHPSH